MAIPTKPTSLTVIRDSVRSSALFVWPKVTGATSYKIYYSSSMSVGSFSVLQTVTAQDTDNQYAVNDSLNQDIVYSFKVSAVNSDGESSASDIAQDF